MLLRLLPLAACTALLAAAAGQPQFDAKGDLAYPADYREWVFLSSGLGMTYGPNASAALDNPMFDNVYVSPAAYASFKQTGKWPEGTMFALEIRYSTSKGSINKGGFFQTDTAAVEVAVKDSKRFPDGWGYFDFGGGVQGHRSSVSVLPQTASCYACHKTNGAVENTFTQFYPTLIAIAEQKGTVKPNYTAAVSPVRLFHNLKQQTDGVAGVLNTAKAAEPTSPAMREPMLNNIAYTLLRSGEQQKAVAVFEWICETYPASPNAYDSLSEAYESGKERDRARQAAQRALALLEQDAAMSPERKERIRKSVSERLARLK